MTWHSAVEIDKYIATLKEKDSLEYAYALSLFAVNAVFPENYEASPIWAENIIPSIEAQEIMDKGSSLFEKIPTQDIYLAILGLFYHHDILIDFRSSNLEAVYNLLNEELLTNKLKWPYRYGRLLYDRYNDNFLSDRTEHILPSELSKLLEDTPQGIYQTGKLLSGPFGFLESQERRYIPPSNRLPLWHCSDTGCNASHAVNLIPPRVNVVEAYAQLSKLANENFGPPSDWATSLRWLLREEGPHRGRRYLDLPLLIANSILGNERTALVENAINSKSGGFLRSIIGSPPREKSVAFGSAKDLASRLSPEEQLQVLLLLSDSELVNLIDNCTSQGLIDIPAKEVRHSIERPPKLRYSDTHSQLSPLGVRSIYEKPIVALSSMIWKAYESSGKQDELDWRLRNQLSTPTRTALMNYIRQNGPADAVRDLLLSSENITKSIADELNLTITHVDENIVVSRFLWKFGFALPLYEDTYSRLRSRLDKFKEVVLNTGSLLTEDDRENIRSVGVNLFVSVEYFIEELIVYNVWILASDHFIQTRFVFDYAEARKQISKVLGEDLIDDEARFHWDGNGENTLGTLLRYLQESIHWMESLLTTDPTMDLRPSGDIPHFADNTLEVFLFRHNALWGDTNHRALIEFIDDFKSIAKQLMQSNLAAIRNGLDHKRDERGFPSVESMLAFVTRFSEAVDATDFKRYLPKSFWLDKKNEDSYGQVEYIFRDYSNRLLVIYGPPLVSGIPNITFNQPFLIAPNDLLGYPNSPLFFKIKENSSYTEYWKGYPRRRTISIKNTVSDDSDSPTPTSNEQ